MIFIYNTYFTALTDFTLGKLLFLTQFFNLQGFHLAFPSPIYPTELPASDPV